MELQLVLWCNSQLTYVYTVISPCERSLHSYLARKIAVISFLIPQTEYFNMHKKVGKIMSVK